MGMAVSCHCGKASIVFSNPKPRFSIECCCFDCIQKLEWCFAQRNVPNPTRAPPTLCYVDNDIVSVTGEQNMNPYILRSNGRSTFIATSCCHSILAVDHPAYRGNTVMVFKEGCSQSLNFTEPKTGRIYVKDWDTVRYPLLPFEGTTLYYDGRDDPADKKLVFGNNFVTPVNDSCRKGETLQTLLGRLGTVTCLNLRENSAL